MNNNLKNTDKKPETKALPEVFKELENIRKTQIKEQLEEKNTKKSTKRKNKKSNRNSKNLKTNSNIMQNSKENKLKNAKKSKSVQNSTYNKQKTSINLKELITERDPLSIIMLSVVALLGITMFSSNYIFAKEEESYLENKPKEIIGTFEENENAINLPEILTENINTTESKEMLTTQRQVEFQTEYTENPKLPKDEQVITQTGILGLEEVSFIRTYTNSEIVNDTIINVKTLENPVTQKIDVGTNEYLAEQKIHIGDTLYAKERTTLYKDMDENSEPIGIIIQNYDVALLDIIDNWCKVQIFDYIGYVNKDSFVSASIDPNMVENCRKQKIVTNVNENMNMNQKSGLTLDDYKTIFSNNSKDVNKIFEQNAEVFYNMEQKYNINGLFVAAIGIHESAWGTSSIAQNKKNLFGYGAYDSDPYNMSYMFTEYADGIEVVAKMLAKYYINPAGTEISEGETAVASYYNGSTIKAVNVRYASDQEWNIKVFNIMKSLYDKIAP